VLGGLRPRRQAHRLSQGGRGETGEKIVFVWQVWPSKHEFQDAEDRMHHDPRMDSAGSPPFDAGRLILGCFSPIAVMGR
jgi:uncharacterized protein YbaA (DUF1428 family)